jgi:formylglycine-generating enzyme required for sulfatase activity/dienelactone hydrolase
MSSSRGPTIPTDPQADPPEEVAGGGSSAALPDVLQFGSRYRVERELGRGGMGRVFAAFDQQLGRRVAIKVLPAGPHGENQMLRFRQEARAAGSLNHPNVLTIFDLGMSGVEPYLVAELLDGRTLRARIDEGPLAPEEAAAWARQIADGIGAAHEKGIVHRDLKPENLFLTLDGRLKVLDFGIAKLREPAEPGPQTVSGAIVGTAGYMSPEQVRGGAADERSDLFSAGVILWEMVTGQPPFRGNSPTEIGYAILNDPPKNTGAPFPAPLERIARRCLEKDPSRRYGSASELSAAIRDASATPIRRRRRWPIAAALLLGVAAAGWLAWRESRLRWAREKALPEIARLIEQNRYPAAFALAQQAAAVIPRDPLLTRFLLETSIPVSIETDPPGADVAIAPYGSEQFQPLGRTPVETRLDTTFHRLRISKEGFVPVDAVEGAVPYGSRKLRFTLDRSLPPGMVRVSGGAIPLLVAGFERLSPLQLPDFYIDRTEVTNRRFRDFVVHGGYSRRDLWREPFVEGGRTLPWEEVVARFRDRTGRPGPSTWVSGDYPPGQDEFPVTGVSWYEAAAFAVFAGRELPTVYHWNRAAGVWASEVILPASNVGQTGLARAGSHGGLGPWGTLDMAGNAKEWCRNSDGDHRYILGGAWNEPPHMFFEFDAQSPFDRGVSNGFRLASYPEEDRISPAARGPLPRLHTRDYAKETPVSDAIFEVYRGLYAGERAPLEPKREELDESSERFRRERVSIASSDGKERVPVYLYLPRHAQPPWQTVVFVPSAGAVRVRSIDQMPPGAIPTFLVTGGRALVVPVLKSMFERGDELKITDQDTTRFYRNHVIDWASDFQRTIDYLETRTEFDRAAIAFYGVSWGAKIAPILLALEPRVRAAVIVGGGLNLSAALPEVDPLHFAPRVRQPVLMINGRHDFVFPVQTSQEPLFRLLGAPPADKRRALFDSGHQPPTDLTVKETLDWLDRRLGTVR